MKIYLKEYEVQDPRILNTNLELQKNRVVYGGETWELDVENAFFIERAKIPLFIKTARFFKVDINRGVLIIL